MGREVDTADLVCIKNQRQLSSVSASTMANATGKMSSLPSTEVADNNIPWYLEFKGVLSRKRRGRQP
ncbi:hypothetical protein ACHQM5_025857 [Ranunculus cassubicifolius]